MAVEDRLYGRCFNGHANDLQRPFKRSPTAIQTIFNVHTNDQTQTDMQTISNSHTNDLQRQYKRYPTAIQTISNGHTNDLQRPYKRSSTAMQTISNGQ
jgi:hypothetical protein